MSKHQFSPLNFAFQSEPEMLENSREFLQKLKMRRTVREFSDRPVPVELINNAISCAGTAPSGANQQPWHFVVISDPALKQKIRQAAEEEEKAFYAHRASQQWLDALAPLGTDADKPFLETAPYLIVVVSKKV